MLIGFVFNFFCQILKGTIFNEQVDGSDKLLLPNLLYVHLAVVINKIAVPKVFRVIGLVYTSDCNEKIWIITSDRNRKC